MQLPPWLRTQAVAARPFARRTCRRPPRTRQPARMRLLLEELEGRVVLSDFLYVGDNVNNTVQRFDAMTGGALGTFVDGNKSLHGPRGMVFDGHGHLLVANQNVNRGKPGEILRYDAATGAFEGELVPFQDPHAPFAPRGMVLKGNVLYVTSLQDAGTTKAGIAPAGEVDEYDTTTGAFLAPSPARRAGSVSSTPAGPRSGRTASCPSRSLTPRT